MKKCNKCAKEKENNEFHKFKESLDSLSSWCKSCKKDYDKNYRKTDKIQTLYKSKRYRDRKLEYRKFRDGDPRIQLLVSARNRAKTNNLDFNIEIDDIIIPEYCPLLNIKLERKPYGEGKSFLPCSPSLDKINPLLGYVKGNIMVISMKANAMKYNASKEELIIFSENILKLFKNEL